MNIERGAWRLWDSCSALFSGMARERRASAIKDGRTVVVMKLDFSGLPGFAQAAEWMNDVLKGDAGSYSLLLEWAYKMAVNVDLPGLDSAEELAKEYLAKSGTPAERVDKLVKDYQVKTGLVGAATGAGGLMTLPVNLVSSTLLQMRMAAAIALMGGWQLGDEKVKRALILCALGSKVVNKLTSAVLEKAAQKAAVKLTGKVMGKSVPLMGMVVSGAIDAAATKTIGVAAKQWFITNVPEVLTVDADFVEKR